MYYVCWVGGKGDRATVHRLPRCRADLMFCGCWADVACVEFWVTHDTNVLRAVRRVKYVCELKINLPRNETNKINAC